MNHSQPGKHKAVVREAAGHEHEQVAESPLYGVAMLKIAMELKKPGAKALDEILTGVLARMSIPEDDFRQFLSQNGGLLKAIAQKKRF